MIFIVFIVLSCDLPETKSDLTTTVPDNDRMEWFRK